MLLDYSGRVNVDSLPNEPILVNRNRLGVRSYSQLKRLEFSFHMAVTASCWARDANTPFLLIRIPTRVKSIILGWIRFLITVTITNMMIVCPSV